MPVRDLDPAEAHRLIPLLHQVHDLHRAHQPERYAPLPKDPEMIAYLETWLSQAGVFALVHEENGHVLGYTIYELEQRPASPCRRAETRAMVHQISVDAEHRRKGIGLSLMAEMRSRLPVDGSHVLATTYAVFNTPSAKLMARAGLSPVITYAELRIGS